MLLYFQGFPFASQGSVHSKAVVNIDPMIRNLLQPTINTSRSGHLSSLNIVEMTTTRLMRFKF